MAGRALAVSLARVSELSFETVRRPLAPEAYEQIFDDIELASLSVDTDCFGRIDLHEANPKDECERLVYEHDQDSRRTAILTLGTSYDNQPAENSENQPAENTSRKRRRTGAAAEDGTVFPTYVYTADGSGKRVNQGYGGDLSFLPAHFPLVCT